MFFKLNPCFRYMSTQMKKNCAVQMSKSLLFHQIETFIASVLICRGVYSTAHTHLEFPPEPLNFQLDPAYFKVFPSPSYIHPPRLPLPIDTECLGKAPDGFHPPPDSHFCHAGFIFAEPVINYIMVSAWLASSQLGPHDRPEIYHSCLVGNDAVRNFHLNKDQRQILTRVFLSVISFLESSDQHTIRFTLVRKSVLLRSYT